MANDDPAVYRENLIYRDSVSTVKSKRRLQSMKDEQRKKREAQGAIAEEIPLEHRDILTLKKLLYFRRKQEPEDTMGVPAMDGRGRRDSEGAHGDYVALEAEGGEPRSVKLKRGRTNRAEQNLRDALDPMNSADDGIPPAIKVAIHSAVVDNVGEELDVREPGVREKANKKVQVLVDKVDMFWDETKIALPRRSPSIYPGEAFKLYKSEEIELAERMEDNEQSDTEEHSAVLEEEEEVELAEEEKKWPAQSVKYGEEHRLADIYHSLDEMKEDEMVTIWEALNGERKRREIDYRKSLVKLLGAIFLLYFRTENYHKFMANAETGNFAEIEDEEPPTFQEIRPLLEVLAKYIRDALRKRKKRTMQKKDYLKNFKRYLKGAIERRNKDLGRRADHFHTVDNSDSMDPDDIGHTVHSADSFDLEVEALNNMQRNARPSPYREEMKRSEPPSEIELPQWGRSERPGRYDQNAPLLTMDPVGSPAAESMIVFEHEKEFKPKSDPKPKSKGKRRTKTKKSVFAPQKKTETQKGREFERVCSGNGGGERFIGHSA